MKIMMTACITLAMLAFTWEQACETDKRQNSALSQSSAQNQSSTQGQNSQATQTSQSSQNTQNASSNQSVEGKVSSDGETLTTDNDSKTHSVNNPDALKDYEDQDVAVLVHVDPDTGAIHIIQVEPTQSMAGKVSSDGKTFVNDSDSKSYTVDNPGALKGHEDKHVAVIVQFDPDNGEIHITHLAMPQQQ